MKSLDMITEEAVKVKLKTKWLGNNIVYYEETDSTNIRAKLLGEQGAESGTVVFAEKQTVGKGRKGRSWVSPKGTGIWMSLLLRPKVNVQHVSMMTIVAALAVVKGLKESDFDCEIKWPNDIVMHKKKICGILTEISTEKEHIHYVVVGIGVNANTKKFPNNIEKTATSIYMEYKKKVARAKAATDILKAFEEYYEVFLKTEDVSALMNDYNQKLINIGNLVKIIENDHERILKSRGIDEAGALLVTNELGEIERIIAGEVSVRGLYDYV